MARSGVKRGAGGVSALALAMVFSAGVGPVAAQQMAQLDLSALSIEELANVEITSVSRRPEPLSQAAAAIFVITRDEIVRSGASSLPAALRLAPNLHVAQLNAGTYGISARGFNHSTGTSNKLQVLIDGRSVYTPLYSGVFWDAQDVLLEDIDRVEVISGPGGTLWGANAVNGVINVVTKSSRDTRGAFMSASVSDGGIERNFNARYGGDIGDHGTYRVYALGAVHRPTVVVAGPNVSDSGDKIQGGFRADWAMAENAFTLQGDIYSGDAEVPPGAAAIPEISGGNISGIWQREWGGTVLETQIYYANERRDPSNGIIAEVDTYNLDSQLSFATGRHALVVGGGYRITRDVFTPGPRTSFLNPADRTLNLGNIFAQGVITLSDALKLTLGMKFEHNSYTGWEYLPNVRLGWQISNASLLWGAISRTVRTPSRFDTDLFAPGLAGGPNFGTETLTAYEIGYRARPSASLSLSISSYYNVYDDLRTLEATTLAVFPLVIANGMEGDAYGVEIWANYALTDWWQLSAGYNYLEKELSLRPGSRDVFGVLYAGNDPGYQFSLRSAMNPFPRITFDVSVRAVGALPSPAVPSYVEADARIAWQVSDEAELSLAGFNLLNDHHLEFVNVSVPRREIPRGVKAGLRWRF